MKLDILLPTSLSEIPLSRYQKFIEMKEQSNDEEFIANKLFFIEHKVDDTLFLFFNTNLYDDDEDN